MQEATFLILTALAAGSQHGYGIIADVLAISGGSVRLRASTLYSALDRLRIDGLIDVDREEVVDSRLRRYYQLTPEGQRQLAIEADRVRSNAAAALTRLDLAGGTSTRANSVWRPRTVAGCGGIRASSGASTPGS